MPVNREAIASATFNAMLRKLPSSLQGAFDHPKEDPKLSTRSGDDIMKLRTLPKLRQPKEFWHPAWCFYEIGVGIYGNIRPNSGGVQFVMYPDNAKCGSGHFRQDVERVLLELKLQKRSGFFVNLAGGPKNRSLLAGFYYYSDENTSFPEVRAASDLAWLISSTVPKFSIFT